VQGALGVKSVLGFGGMLPSRDLFAVILFSKIHIPRAIAELFKTLGLIIKLANQSFRPRPDLCTSRRDGRVMRKRSALGTTPGVLCLVDCRLKF
jgi:hypothetical protein